MSKINRERFYQKFPFRPLSTAQVVAVNQILDYLDASTLITRLQWYAYILATIKHETAETYRPIHEYGSQAYLRSKRYYPYFGRGYVQLTWNFNYMAFGDFLNIDLLKNPDYALDPVTAWKILEEGMTNPNHTFKDLSFTKHTLEEYFNDNKTDWIGARRIINGTDRASLIASYAIKFYDCLEFIDEEKAIAVNPVEPDPQIVDEELQAHKADLSFAENFTEEMNGTITTA